METSTSSELKKEEIHEVYEFSDFICNQIDSFKQHLLGFEKRKRFSPHIMRAALALWSKAGTRAYNEFQKSSYNCYPSLQSMQYVKRALSVKEGF